MVSVVIPSYNRAKTIRRSVESVLAQEGAEKEVIVVDDCSDDNTREVLDGIGSGCVRYIRLDKNSGACVARNTGIGAAKGELIAFQDSDDVWLPGKLAKQVSVIENEGADICICALRRHYTGKNGKIVIYPQSVTESGFVTHTDCRRKSLASTQTIIAKRKVFDEHLFDPAVKKSQDYDWMIRATRDNSVYFIAEPLVEQYLQDDSITLSGAEKTLSAMSYLMEKYRDECKEDKYFKLNLLKKIAHYKVVCGQDATEEYKEISRIDNSLKNRLRVPLSKMGLMRLFIK